MRGTKQSPRIRCQVVISQRITPAINSSDSYLRKKNNSIYIYRMEIAITTAIPQVEKLIIDYMEQKQRSLYHHKKKTDAEKEYNKLLAISGGEGKNFSITEAERIYKAYRDMQVNEEQSKLAEEKYDEVYRELQELGRILFYGNISAEITIPPVNGSGPVTKFVTVSFPNGEVVVG